MNPLQERLFENVRHIPVFKQYHLSSPLYDGWLFTPPLSMAVRKMLLH